jgi:AcrR family transcriptional regulator
MSTQAQRRHTTRELILRMTTKIIIENGYSACSIATIASNSSFTSGAIQHYFKSKEELLAAVVTEYIFKLNPSPLNDFDFTAPLEQRCKKVIDAMWEYYGHEYYSVVWEVLIGARENQTLLNYIDTFFEKAESQAVKNVSEVFSDLALNQLDAKELTQFISAHLRGVSLLRLTKQRSKKVSAQLEYLHQVVVLKVQFFSENHD